MMEDKFQKVVEIVRTDLASIRTGKATPSLIENLEISAYEMRMKLVELATIAASDPTTLVVTPFDVANVEAIVKAIGAANLGLTAIPEDMKIRVVVPPLSEQRRQEYVKLVKVKVEGGKIMVRQIRHEAMEEIARSDADEDTKKHREKETQALTDKIVAELDLLEAEKIKEILTL
jgi:ribosome recycling factor